MQSNRVPRSEHPPETPPTRREQNQRDRRSVLHAGIEDRLSTPDFFWTLQASKGLQLIK